MLTLVKRSTERYHTSFTARFCNVTITLRYNASFIARSWNVPIT